MTTTGRGASPPFRILAVDDEPAICALVARLLATPGSRAEVERCTQAPRAVQLVSTGDFDLVVSDYQFPGSVTGLDVLRAARNARPEGYRVLMSAYGDIPVSPTALRAAAPDAILPKPFDNADARTLLSAFVDARPVTIAEHRARVARVLAEAGPS